MSSSDKRFIAFEGIDGSGKTTQSALFVEFLKGEGKDVFYTMEPGATKTGKVLRELVLHHEVNPVARLFMFLADRSLNAKLVRMSIESGMYVVSDRSMYSTVAYQHFGEGMDRDFIDECNEVATGGVKPDIVFVIDVPVEESLGRLRSRDVVESFDLGFFQRVREGYISIAAEDERVFVVDGRGSAEEVFSRIRSIWDSL